MADTPKIKEALVTNLYLLGHDYWRIEAEWYELEDDCLCKVKQDMSNLLNHVVLANRSPNPT